MWFTNLNAGVGSFALGLQQSGHRPLLLCESNTGARRVLSQHFPGILLAADAEALERLPKETEILAVSIPCTNRNLAGIARQEAFTAARQVLRLLKRAKLDHRPVPWVLLESGLQVLTPGDSGRPAMEELTGLFVELGYMSWGTRIVNSAGFGTPLRQERVLLAASFHGDARDLLLVQGAALCCGACEALFEGRECYSCRSPPKSGVCCAFSLENKSTSKPVVHIDYLPALEESCRPALILADGSHGLLRFQDAEKAAGLGPGWTKLAVRAEHGGQQRDNGTVGNHEAERSDGRWSLISSSISVRTAAWLGTCLNSPHRFKYLAGAKDQPFPQFGASNCGVSEKSQDSLPLAIFTEGEVDNMKNWEWDLTGSGQLYPCKSSSVSSDSSDALPEDRLQADSVAHHYQGKESHPNLTSMSAEGQKTWEALEAGLLARDRTWPRAAWYLCGTGRFEAQKVCPAPVLSPATPLGSFIRRVGEPLKPEFVQSCLKSLRDQGVRLPAVIANTALREADLHMKLQKAKDNSGLQFSETIGTVAWAQLPGADAEAVWWPAEILDPFNLPRSRSLPAGAAAMLSREERKLSIPAPKLLDMPQDCRRHADQPTAWVASAVPSGSGQRAVPEQDVKIREEIANASHARENPRTGVAFPSQKAFVLFLGLDLTTWQQAQALLPFRAFQNEKETAAAVLDAKHELPHSAAFQAALKEAQDLEEVKEGSVCAAKLLSCATARAAAITKHPRCQQCETCITSQMGRCLLAQATEAAVSGHPGAQLAILRESAVGAKIKVWWPLDEEWYLGSVTDFVPGSLQHVVEYEDGDTELLKLWAPDQGVGLRDDCPAARYSASVGQACLCLVQVQLVNIPSEWPAAKASFRAQGRTEDVKVKPPMLDIDGGKRESAQLGSDDEPNAYEHRRRQNMRHNREVFARLMAGETLSALEPDYHNN